MSVAVTTMPFLMRSVLTPAAPSGESCATSGAFVDSATEATQKARKSMDRGTADLNASSPASRSPSRLQEQNEGAGSSAVTRTELEQLIDRVRRRHNMRVLALWGLMSAVLFGGFVRVNSLYPRFAGPERGQAAWRVIAVFIGLSVIGFAYVFDRVKKDCFRLGVVCPACHRHLYTRRRLLFGGPGTRRTGQCPH